MHDDHTLCTNSSIFSIAWWACSGSVRTSSSSSSSSARQFAPCGHNQSSKGACNTAGTEYERLCNTFWLIIMWLASDWIPLAPLGSFSSSRGPSSISSMSAGTSHSSMTWESAWLADLIWPDISRLPCDPSQTSEASTSVHWGPKVIHSIKTKLHSQSQDMTHQWPVTTTRDCLPLAGALNTGRSKPASWCLPCYEIAYSLGKKQQQVGIISAHNATKYFTLAEFQNRKSCLPRQLIWTYLVFQIIFVRYHLLTQFHCSLKCL